MKYYIEIKENGIWSRTRWTCRSDGGKIRSAKTKQEAQAALKRARANYPHEKYRIAEED